MKGASFLLPGYCWMIDQTHTSPNALSKGKDPSRRRLILAVQYKRYSPIDGFSSRRLIKRNYRNNFLLQIFSDPIWRNIDPLIESVHDKKDTLSVNTKRLRKVKE